MNSGSHNASLKRHAHRANGSALLRGLALAVAVSGAAPAFAELGGAPTLGLTQRVAAESRKAAAPTAGNAVTETSTGWSTREVTLPDGLVEREYLGADGTVFAVAWRGPHRPELSVLLGTPYATQMSRDARALRRQGRGAHGSTSQMGETFAVQASTHQRSSVGVAWLPRMLPPGTDPSALSIAPGS
ncbi:DUF2844 domain-containing protein [Variovorax sp. ZS18.2.2]|uniref:DUF2844 domain-containing protein n=1 Tax=Variovorax sp. ZS18.2.2 TaxID=2971255 RepID=UPI00215113C4|nr:DUF2844 domain-containing protein [Variovorax sp. ZS18.2.2]MCR6476286.1 DUF2844 domain-containing protein [Variovorax sp. ZS18.2.2]